jgi:UDP:flavonoid glycosyltransferase YjiC (YdhE family)
MTKLSPLAFLACSLLVILALYTAVITASVDNTYTAHVTDYSKYYNAKPHTNGKKHIFFSGIPMPGHIFPLLATAEELALRGYTVTIATVKSIAKTVRNHKHPLVNQIVIGECSNLVEEWRQLQIDMNNMIEFSETSREIFSWVQRFHPCYFTQLYSTLSRFQTNFDVDRDDPNHVQIPPPIDFIVSDIVTQPLHETARALSIPFLLNNPDILQILPSELMGKWDLLPVLFHEDTIHPFSSGIEIRTYTENFDNSQNAPQNVQKNVQKTQRDAFATDFSKLVSVLSDSDPYAYLKHTRTITTDNSDQEFGSYTVEVKKYYSFFARWIYSLARPLVHWFIVFGSDIKTSIHRHHQGELHMYFHLQHYVKLLRSKNIPEHLFLQITQTEKDMIKKLLNEYNFDNINFLQMCENYHHHITQKNPEGISLIEIYNKLLSKYFSSEFMISFPESLCNTYTKSQSDFDQSITLFLSPPKNPERLEEYFQSFIFLFSMTTHYSTPMTPHSPFRFSWKQYSHPWLRIFSTFWFTTPVPNQPTPTILFDSNSFIQHQWRFYDLVTRHWTSLSQTTGTPVLQGTVFGVEYQRPIPPQVHMLGPLIPESNSGISSTTSTTPTTERQITWLNGHDDDNDDNNDDPIVYMSFGTLGHVSHEGTIALFQAYAELVEHTKVRIMWKLTSHYVEMVVDCYLESGVYIEGFFDAVNSIKKGANYLKTIQGKISHFNNNNHHRTPIPTNRWFFTEWVYSQYGVLDHKNTKIFLSHCGINSAFESILAGTYTLCIPLFGDQGHMAMMMSDRGVGTALYKQHVTKDTLIAALRFSLVEAEGNRFPVLVNRLKAQMELSGGKSRAADWVEFYLNHGSQHTKEVVTYNRAYFKQDHFDIVQYRYSHLTIDQRVGYQEYIALPLQGYLQSSEIDVHLSWFIFWHIVIWVCVKVCTFWFNLFVRCFCCGKKRRNETDSKTNGSAANQKVPQTPQKAIGKQKQD